MGSIIAEVGRRVHNTRPWCPWKHGSHTHALDMCVAMERDRPLTPSLSESPSEGSELDDARCSDRSGRKKTGRPNGSAG